MTDREDGLTEQQEKRRIFWTQRMGNRDNPVVNWLVARPVPVHVAGERVSVRRLAPAFRDWVEKGRALRDDVLRHARRYPQLLDPEETAAATTAEIGHLAVLARDAQRAERTHRRTEYGRQTAFGGNFFARRDAQIMGDSRAWSGAYHSPVARALLAQAAARLDALEALAESYRKLADERPALDDAAVGMLARAEVAADDRPGADLAERAAQLRALLAPEAGPVLEED
ncbi:hypothetical protein OIU91_03965 [Streptomyces sp. NBC_01456]|uniref:hypothetical protein n=1 Tax=unclassified Streptomyces TaxID=2593676 RepID=UPI002E31D9AE|nr:MULTISPECIES: hypothetical protein [unclassified Streptomyces]